MADADTDPEDLLARTDLFSGMSRRDVRKLARVAKPVDHREGAEVAAEGLGALAFHLIVSGEAVVLKGGREVRRLSPGEYFGEISMIDGQPRSATVQAVSPMRTVAISHEAFDRVLDEEPSVARALLVLLASRLRSAEASY